MSQLTLHSYRRCPFAIRVRMVLEELELTYVLKEEDLANPSLELQALHPEVRVPLLLHGDHVVFESSVITEYLVDTFSPTSLMPASAKLKSIVRLWTVWCNQVFKPDLDQFKYDWKGLSEERRTELVDRLQGHLNKMMAQLEDRPFLVGQELTLADIHLFPFYRQLTRVQPGFEQHILSPAIAALEDWLKRITSRASFDRVMKK